MKERSFRSRHVLILYLLLFLSASGYSQSIIPDSVWKDLEKLEHGILQNITYKRDPGVEYWKLPIQTILDGSGDCEDMAILFAYMAGIVLRPYRVKPVLVIWNTTNPREQHVGVRILDRNFLSQGVPITGEAFTISLEYSLKLAVETYIQGYTDKLMLKTYALLSDSILAE